MKYPSLVIIGGSYGEECSFPRHQSYRGSGGRGAAFLSSLGVPVTLNSFTGPELAPFFNANAAQFGYEFQAYTCSDDVWFRYRYPLGKPSIFYNEAVKRPTVAPIRAELALVFGMIEGRIPVHAKRVVYDPQDGSNATRYESNGSTAEELAIVVSYSEGKALSGESDCLKIANTLLAQANVSVVVVKCGPQGALVKSSSIEEWVRPFPTGSVYKIGSGDIFSAAFSFFWLLENQDPLAAAWLASRFTAAYVETAQDSVEQDKIPQYRTDAESAAIKSLGKGHRAIPDTQVYLAAPFFNTAEQWRVDEVRDSLKEMGFKVFSPIHDVGLGRAEDVAPADILGLEESGLVIALLDGLDPGTVFEVGYARGKGIPVVAVAESVDPEVMTMVAGSGCEITNDLTTGIYAACWHLMGDA